MYIPKTQDIYIQRVGYICPIYWIYIPNKLDVYTLICTSKHLHDAILSFIPLLFIFVKEVKDVSLLFYVPISP